DAHPWIENLILSYDSQEMNCSRGQLKAHVIGVSQMSLSQAQGSEGPTGLLFLSDGVLQIPAVLTASAWEHLQEQEDRECFTSLLNTTVCIQDYRLQFHMALEQNKCRFFLTIGELASTSAGPVKDSTPCCTTLSSVRLKICKTWKALQGQEEMDSQRSQCGFDLSELLGEWQHDCLQAVLDDVRKRLMVVNSCPVGLHTSGAFSATSWDVDRVRYKGMKHFSVPIKCLLIPEGDAQQQKTPPNAGSRTPNLAPVCKPSEITQASVDAAEWEIATPVVAERNCGHKEHSPPPVEDFMLHEDMIAEMIDTDIRPMSNPWDIFPPPCDASSSSDASPDATPIHPLHKSTTAESRPDHATIITSTQIPLHSSKESQPKSDPSSGQLSYFPPYQKPPHMNSLLATADPSTSTFTSPLGLFPKPSNLPKTPTVHSDGMPFSYTYHLTGQNLLDFSRFKIDESLLQWALKYLLVPQCTDTTQKINTVANLSDLC
uniref:ACD shelterin complex subunit and telomerase recruitment factor n=1 Tax=Mastacembelus armatus TaxID=205130 RepID=A0A7N8X387_9TELE